MANHDNPYDAYEIDDRKARDGVWHTFAGNCRLKLAYMNGSPEIAAAVNRRKRAHGYQEYDIPSGERLKEINAEVYAEVVVMDIKANGRDGKPIPNTFDAKRRLLIDLPELYNEIIAVTGRRDRYLASAAERDAGNLSGASSGKESTEKSTKR